MSYLAFFFIVRGLVLVFFLGVVISILPSEESVAGESFNAAVF